MTTWPFGASRRAAHVAPPDDDRDGQATRRLALAVARGLSWESVCERVAAEVAEITGSSAVCIARIDSASEATLVGVAGHDTGLDKQFGNTVTLTEDTVVGRVARTGQAARISPYPRGETARGDYLGVRFSEGMGFPITVGPRLWGVLALGQPHGHPTLPGGEPSATIAGMCELIAASVEMSLKPSAAGADALLSATMASVSSGIIIVDEDLRVIRHNAVAEAQFGFTDGSLAGRPIDRLLPLPLVDMCCYAADVRQGFAATLLNSPLRSAGVGSSRLTVAAATGEGPEAVGLTIVIEDIPDDVALSARDGRLAAREQSLRAHADAVVRDVLERQGRSRTSQRELRRQADLFRLVTELESDGVFALDLDGTMLFLNEAAATRLGTTPTAAEGKLLDAFLPAEAVRTLRARAAAVAAAGVPRVFRLELTLLGDATELLFVLAPFTVDGTLLGVAGIARDITHHEAGERSKEILLARERAAGHAAQASIVRLEAQNGRLRELDRSKDEILALISHDLRTPLTSMMGYSELLARDAESLDPRHRRFVDIITSNGDRLVELLDDLLLVAQYQAGGFTITAQELDLCPLILQSVDAAIPQAKRKGILITHTLADAVPAQADPRRFTQLLDNLISNAVKYTQDGGFVEVTAERENDDWAVVRVRDNGPGISIEEQVRIFERFTRARDAMQGGVRGFGLGLTIAHAIAHAHGGRLGVDSTPGTGAEFWVELPAAVAPAPAGS